MYKTTIGLEIHFEGKTKSKMFCSCLNDPNEKIPNTNICPICTGHPGTLPVINEEAINKLILVGLALNCEIAKHSKFDRKSYFYPDLPKGYQISQYDLPLCKNGYLDINLDDGTTKKIRINRIHMEEDTGRLGHSSNSSLVDFNRAGVPLMELVTEADINSSEEAKKFAQELQLILRYLDVSDADMEKGQMRCEVNISISKTDAWGTKVEIKNLNSFRVVEKSIEFEIKRQAEILESGGSVVQETRGWHDTKQITMEQRSKEDAFEYRYFPEPDLPPINVNENIIINIQKHMPELPEEKRIRFKEEYKLDDKSIEFFVKDIVMGNYFEKIVSELNCWCDDKECKMNEDFDYVKICSNYLSVDFQAMFKNDELLKGKEYNTALLESIITPENFGEFICMIGSGELSSKTAKMVLEEMYKTHGDPSSIVEEKGLSQMTDSGEVEGIIKDVLAKNPKAVEDYKAGKQNSFTFLVGQIMAASKGKANPQSVGEMLKKELDN
ncbi:MAG: Asp-tRNA(Asn)/Glu-tRNA(Gln) amidotransferase subunit GatB [Candidatus Pacebacteria bacterium]|nr:Asp-tRNA(Asn)/Glu-tRNA(Gln) amidotransferase subunit GatB [Candidatus Paceibacterota bacterium]